MLNDSSLSFTFPFYWHCCKIPILLSKTVAAKIYAVSITLTVVFNSQYSTLLLPILPLIDHQPLLLPFVQDLGVGHSTEMLARFLQ